MPTIRPTAGQALFKLFEKQPETNRASERPKPGFDDVATALADSDLVFDRETLNELHQLNSDGFASVDDSRKLSALVDGLRAYLVVRPNILGFKDSAVPERVVKELISTMKAAPSLESLNTQYRETRTQPKQSVYEALGENVEAFLNAADTPERRTALVELARRVYVPPSDPGFAGALAAFVDFGVSQKEFGDMEQWLQTTAKRSPGLFQTNGSELVVFASKLAEGRRVRTTKPPPSDSELKPLVDSIKMKPNYGGPGVDRMQALDLLGNQEVAGRAGERAISTAVLNDLGELIRARDTSVPTAVGDSLAPEQLARLNPAIDRRLAALKSQQPAGLDEATAAVWRLDKLQEQLGLDYKPVSRNAEKAYDILAQRLLVAERTGAALRTVAGGLNEELADPTHPASEWLKGKKTGADIKGSDLVALRSFYLDATPPGMENASPEALEAFRSSRRRALSFWAEHRTDNLAALKQLTPPRKTTGGWGAAPTPASTPEQVRKNVEKILREDCGLDLDKPLDPKAKLKDLGLESIQFLQLASSLEYEYGIKIRSMEDGVKRLSSVNDIEKAIRERTPVADRPWKPR